MNKHCPGSVGTCVSGTVSGDNTRELQQAILALKRKLNAVILAHNYQVPEIQDLADHVGDSLRLAQLARASAADVIVFCGVRFMAETAKILNPDRLVLLPDMDAGCSLEESCPADALAALQRSNPNFYTIAYINCSAAVKALSDIICTSGNAELIVRRAPTDRDLLFVPDENLGQWVMEQTGRKMTLWKGNCYLHVAFTADAVLELKRRYPPAEVVVHPEATAEVRRLANVVCSTEKMVSYCRDSQADTFIIVTESSMLHRLRKECPGKRFLTPPVFDAGRVPTDPCACAQCKYMKLNTLEKLLRCMESLRPRIELPGEILQRARVPIERMLEVTARAG